MERLNKLLGYATGDRIELLSQLMVEELEAPQLRWSDEVEVKAEPWTM